MLTPEQVHKMEELWRRGLMKISSHCPRLCALVDEAVGAGLNMDQIRYFLKKARADTGMNTWEHEDIDREVLIAMTLEELRVRRGISLQDEVNILALTGSQKTGSQPRAASPSEPQEASSGCPPLTPRPAGQPLSFGEGNDCGQLGTLDNEERLLPTPVALPAGKIIVDVAAGAMHSAFLTSEGGLLTCGLNDEGELLRPTAQEEDCLGAASTSLIPAGLVVAEVSCGGSFTAVRDTLGRVFWAGQLRDSGGVFHDIGPRLVEVPLWAPATKISAGGDHLAVLVGHKIATCGAASHGQLGRMRARQANKRTSKKASLILSPWTTAAKFTDVCCGDCNTLGLTAAGDVWGCGANHQYQLALEGPGIIWTHTRIPALSRLQLVQVAMGEMHGVGLSSSGAVFCWGDRCDGQLGDGTIDQQEPSVTPLVVQGLPNNIRQVAAGPRQSYCWTSQGHAYAWGSGGSDQLCVGDQVYAKESPFPMVGLRAPILKIAVGAQHAIVLVGVPPAPSST
ncbi:regulator of chromosome condensation-like [Branchiostoma lanceolatum]|uniref:RCC1 protein n=1 Tax=Branchiostoma lanceolatum TaxID=7740 RepID=A0A8J9ZUJ2_BRALA|nr:RCC1 [Branchiostoma lanceolatum]